MGRKEILVIKGPVQLTLAFMWCSAIFYFLCFTVFFICVFIEGIETKILASSWFDFNTEGMHLIIGNFLYFFCVGLENVREPRSSNSLLLLGLENTFQSTKTLSPARFLSLAMHGQIKRRFFHYYRIAHRPSPRLGLEEDFVSDAS